MANNELIQRAPATFAFQDKKLNEISERIAEIGTGLANSRIELAKALGEISRDKLYTQDGFKSVADYAEQTFGIKRANAYQLAKVGERFYLSDTDTARTAAAMLSPSCLAELTTLSDEEIEDAIQSGDISEDSTQAELRSIKTKANEGKETVLKNHHIDAVCVKVDTCEVVKCEFKSATKADLEDWLNACGFNVTDMNAKKFGDYTVYVDAAGNMARAEFSKAEKPEKPTKPNFTKEQLMAMLAELGE